MIRAPLALAIAVLLALPACGGGDDLTALEAELAADGVDPALAVAIEDPILTDPGLRQQAQATAVRPPEAPVQALYPLGEDPAEPPPGPCEGGFEYGPQWAKKMPASLPLPPDARVTEAAGSADGACRMVAFAADRPAAALLDHYRTAAARAGFTAQAFPRGDEAVVLVGSGPGSFYLLVRPRGEGAEAALLVEGG